MTIGRLMALILLSATVGCSSSGQMLARACRASARIEIHDPGAWATYLAAVRATDLQTQRSIAQGRLTGQIQAPPDLQAYIRPFPYVVGYDFEYIPGQPDLADTPRAVLRRVQRAGQTIATLHDFQIKAAHFEYTDFPSCSSDYPEVFGLRRTVLDHY
jgi:hypothetical protein